MTRFVVEEGGHRRAFKVGEGVITVGSGAHATLKLTSPGVAELHAEIEVHAGVVKLRPKPGVMPPVLAGRPTTSETILPKGVALSIGEAVITVDPPEKSAAPAKAVKHEKQAWERSNRELYKEKGLKPAQVLMILGPLAVIAFFVINRFIGSAPAPTIGAEAVINKARENMKSAMWDQAETELRTMPGKDDITEAQKATVKALLAEIEEGRKKVQDSMRNQVGDQFKQTQLVNFEQQYMASKIDRPAVRVFLKRLAEFEKRWPDHPEMEWIQRKKERYADLADLSQPPTFADIEFETRSLTWASPRNYREAIPMLERWLETAQGADRSQGATLLEKMITDRQAWFEDRLLQAAHEFKKGQLGQSVEWLAVLMAYTGDSAMTEKATTELLKFHGLEVTGYGVVDLCDSLRGYRRSKPHYWEQMTKIPSFNAWLKEHPLD